MSSLIPPEFRKLRSSGSPITMSPPVRACTMLSIPSRSAVPGAIISSALIRPGSGLTSLSKSSPDRGATIPHSRALSISLAPPTRRADGACAARSGERGSAGAGCPETGTGRGARAPERVRERLAQARRLARRAAAVGRRDHALAAVLGGLLQAPLGVPYPAQLARQAELAEARPRRATEWLPARRAGNRERHRQVAAGLLEAHPADDVDEHVRRTRAHAAVTSQDREHQRKAVAVEPRDDPARLLELGRRDQRLDLHQQRPRALHRREHHAAGRAGGLGHEARRGVEHLHEAALAHLEQARLVGRAEAVLQRAQLAVGALALALELQHAVDEVLKHARA